MNYDDDYKSLSPRDKARFKSVVTRLWAGDVIMPGTPMKPDHDWVFLERFHPIVSSYLDAGDWDLDLRQKPALARAVHRSSRLRVEFNKFDTMVILVLRLMYHEQMGGSVDREDCTVRVNDIRERLHEQGYAESRLGRQALRDSLRRLARHQLVQVPRGFNGVPDEEITVTPAMEAVLPENLGAYRAKLAEYATTLEPRRDDSNAAAEEGDTRDGADEGLDDVDDVEEEFEEEEVFAEARHAAD